MFIDELSKIRFMESFFAHYKNEMTSSRIGGNLDTFGPQEGFTETQVGPKSGPKLVY